MAKIPQFAQDQLASSVVGTPGVDNSGAMLSGAMDNATAQMAGALQSSNQAMRNAADDNYIRAQNQQRQDIADAGAGFKMVAREIQQRAALQRQQDAYDLQQLQAEQKERERVQRNAIQEQAASNAALQFDLKSTDTISAIQSDKSVSPEAKPKAIADALAKLRDDSARQLPMEVATRLNSHANTAIASRYKESSKQALTEATQKVVADRKYLEEQSVGAVRDPAQYQKFVEDITNKDTQVTMTRVWDEKAKDRTQDLIKMAGENLARAQMNDGLLDKAQQTLATVPLDESKRASLQGSLDAKLKARDADLAKAEKIDDDLEWSKAAQLVNSIKANPDAPDYHDQLAKGRAQVQDMLDAELAKPPKPPNAEKFDLETGRPIEYQRKAVVKALETRRNEMDALLQKEVAQEKAASKEAAVEQTKEHKAQVAAQKATVQEAAAAHWASGEKYRAKLQEALGTLSSYKITAPSDSKHAFKTTHETAGAYAMAVEAYRKAEQHGALDLPGARGTKPSQIMLQHLVSVGERLRHGKPSALDRGLTERSMYRLTSAAPQGLARIMSEWHGKSADQTNYEYTARMLRAYDMFKAQNPDIEPREDIINHWQEKIHANMLKRAATGRK